MQPLYLDPLKFPTAGAHFAEAIKTGVIIHSMVVIVLADDAERARLLHEHATNRGGTLLKCDRWRTDKQFLNALAGVLGVRETRITYDMFHRIIDALNDDPRPLFFDHAERLRPGAFSRLRSIYDQVGVLIVMAGGTPKLIDKTDDREQGGQFFSRRIRRDIDAAMEADRETPDAADDSAGVIGRIGRDQDGGGEN